MTEYHNVNVDGETWEALEDIRERLIQERKCRHVSNSELVHYVVKVFREKEKK